MGEFYGFKLLITKGEIHQDLDSNIVVFDLSFSNKKYTRREKCGSRAWWISAHSSGGIIFNPTRVVMKRKF